MSENEILSIDAFILSDKLTEPFYFSQFEYTERKICIVKVTTADGTVGWGEGYGPATLVKAGIEFLSPLAIGRDALHHENIWYDMFRHSYDYARKGIFLSALSAIDIALWDIKGKILGQPVSTLLGGRKREKVKLYATGLYFTNGGNMAKKLVDEALKYKAKGFGAIKMKVGLGIRQDVLNVKAVRDAIGNNTDLMIDANHAYNLADARKLLHALEGCNITWFEEPISNDDYAGYAELRKLSKVPIAAGECEYLKYGALELLSRGCVDLFQPDTCACGGITEVKKMTALAEAYHINITPHNWGTGIAIAANLHILSNLEMIPQKLFKDEPMLELDCSPNKLRENLLSEYPETDNGYMHVPDKPGLGICVDEERILEFSNSSVVV